MQVAQAGQRGAAGGPTPHVHTTPQPGGGGDGAPPQTSQPARQLPLNFGTRRLKRIKEIRKTPLKRVGVSEFNASRIRRRQGTANLMMDPQSSPVRSTPLGGLGRAGIRTPPTSEEEERERELQAGRQAGRQQMRTRCCWALQQLNPQRYKKGAERDDDTGGGHFGHTTPNIWGGKNLSTRT